MNTNLTIDGKPSTEKDFIEKFRATNSRPVYLTSLEVEDCYLVQMQQQGDQPELSCEVSGLTRALRGKLYCRQYLNEPLSGAWPLGKLRLAEEIACRKREKRQEHWRKSRLGNMLMFWWIIFGGLAMLFDQSYVYSNPWPLAIISLVIAFLLAAVVELVSRRNDDSDP